MGALNKHLETCYKQKMEAWNTGDSADRPAQRPLSPRTYFSTMCPPPQPPSLTVSPTPAPTMDLCAAERQGSCKTVAQNDSQQHDLPRETAMPQNSPPRSPLSTTYHTTSRGRQPSPLVLSRKCVPHS